MITVLPVLLRKKSSLASCIHGVRITREIRVKKAEALELNIPAKKSKIPDTIKNIIKAAAAIIVKTRMFSRLPLAISLLRLIASIMPLLSITIHSSVKISKNMAITHRIKNSKNESINTIIFTGEGINTRVENGIKNRIIENVIIRIHKPAIRYIPCPA
jgi:hypothetical protein